jgi:C4-dicarboxylate-specific signal transduction histidine kinase
LSAGKNWHPNHCKAKKPTTWLNRHFGGLRVRYKLVVLHNLFFSVLAIAVYLSVIPVFAEHIASAMQRELHMVSQIFGAELPMSNSQESKELGGYDLRVGSAMELGLSEDGEAFLADHPASTWQQGSASLFRLAARPGQYRRVSLSSEFYGKALRQARISLFVVLGTIYLLSIFVMEFIIMPQYVYQPLQLMLQADEATLGDDREHEMIDAQFILDDEIGQIMRSRNATVAQLRRQEDDLANALQRLEEQDRLVSLGLLSTSVAHELNTPLAVLQGSIEKLLETGADAHTIERLERMLRVTQRLRKISEGLVDFARVRKQVTEAVALRPLIDESWQLVAIDEKAAIVTFRNEVQESAVVLGNADRLVQVFVNLLRNALNAVSSDGVISAQSKCIQRGGQKCVGCMVSDNGPGISEHLLPSLFEAFVTTRLDARGTGLGLTVAEGIVTQHGGTISASNRPEGGASLEVVLPAAS